ncbi:MAG TPA: hypothetical protein VMY37_22700 [Thermoguttaceae bacterium]|nr:hypothetical protein [Thermoguttaceae bacterium]
MDANGNGVIEPSEVPEERRGMLRYMAGRMGLDPEKPIPLDQVRQRMNRSDRDRDEEPGSGKSADEPEPLVPGFGEKQELARVAAFGERVEYPTLGSSASQSALSKIDPERASRIRGFADSMFARYDRNQNGVLDKEEWESSRFAQGADRNNDGKVTKDELTARMAEFSGRRSEDSDRGSSQGDNSDGSGDSGSSKSNGRKSYRFRRAPELLPSGLPDWFARDDVNGDGQVAMVEYSSSWSESKAREFLRYDLNHDGMITPRECLDTPTTTGELAGAGDKSAGPGGPPAAPGGPPSGPGAKPPADSKQEGGTTPWWLQ